MKNPFKKLIASFKFAFNGLSILIREEQNARIHFLASIAVISAGIYLELSPTEWCLVCLAIGMVIITEIINTLIENTLDFITEEQNSKIGKIKDVAASAVLIAAFIALAIAAFVFIPKLIP